MQEHERALLVGHHHVAALIAIDVDCEHLGPHAGRIVDRLWRNTKLDVGPPEAIAALLAGVDRWEAMIEKAQRIGGQPR